MANQYVIDKCQCGSLTLGGLSELNISPNVAAALDSGGADIHPTHVNLTGQTTELTGATYDVKTLLDALTGDGQIIPHLPIGASPFDFHQKRLAGANRGAAGTVEVRRIAAGLVVPTRLFATRNFAMLGFRVYADDNGTDPVIQVLGAQSPLAGVSGAGSVWRLHSVVSGTSNYVKNAQAIAIDFGINVKREQSDAQRAPVNSYPSRYAPTATFASTDLAAIVSGSGLTPAYAPTDGLTVYLAEYDGTAAGYKLTGGLALTFAEGSGWFAQRVSVAELCTVDYRLVGVGAAGFTDGNQPLAYADGQALPSLDDVTTRATYTAGPVYDGATRIGYTDASVEFNHREQMQASDETPWPIAADLLRSEPSARVTLVDAEYYRAVGAGKVVDAAGFRIMCRGKAANSEPYADGESEHLMLKINAGMIVPEAERARNGASDQAVRVVAKAGAAAIMTVASGVTMAGA